MFGADGYDTQEGFIVPEGHHPHVIYCVQCGSPGHSHFSCTSYSSQEPVQYNNRDRKHYDITSYSGNNPNKNFKRAKKFEEAEKRLTSIQSNPDLMRKLC